MFRRLHRNGVAQSHGGRAARGVDGASTVEFAILAPLVIGLIFSMLSGGIAWNTKQAISFAAREAARWGATLPVDDDVATVSCATPSGGDVCDLLHKMVDRAKATAVPEANDGTAGRVVCAAYIGETIIHRLVLDADGDRDYSKGNDSSVQCYDDDLPLPNDPSWNNDERVQGYASRTVGLWVMLVYLPEFRMRSGAVAIHESTPTS